MINSPPMGCPVLASISECTHVMLPNDANPMGMVLGGHIMHLIDICGALAAMRHSRGSVVTACVDHITFLHPVHIGQVLVLKSSVNRVFHTSMEVGVKVWVEDVEKGEIHHTSSAYLTFVRFDRAGKPIVVPPVIPETEEEKRRFDAAGWRRQLRLRARGQAHRLGESADARRESTISVIK